MQKCGSKTIHPLSRFKKFLELPLTRRREMVESRGLCWLCFTAYGSEVKRTQKECRRKKSFPLSKEWRRELNKDRRSHHRLMRLGEGEEKDRVGKKKAM
jgi:hypothetical protein